MRILVSGASGIVGYGIAKTLKKEGHFVVCTALEKNSPVQCFADAVEIVSKTTDSTYFFEMEKIIKRYRITVVFPGIELDVKIWSMNKEFFVNNNVTAILNNPELIKLCNDKWIFYQTLSNYGFSNLIPTSIQKGFDEFSVPFVMKPRCGTGGKGLIRVASEEEFNQNKQKLERDYIKQKYIESNREMTVGVFFDYNSVICASIILSRKLSVLGYSNYVEVVKEEEGILKLVQKLGEIVKPIGPTNFQFIHDIDGWKLLEINPRISSSTSLRALFNYNEAQMSIDYFVKGESISQPEIRMGRAIRYVEDFVIYDGDNI